jgi:hypothetical protein
MRPTDPPPSPARCSVQGRPSGSAQDPVDRERVLIVGCDPRTLRGCCDPHGRECDTRSRPVPAGYVLKPVQANELIFGALTVLRHARGRADGQEAVARLALAIRNSDPGAASHLAEMSEHSGRLALALGLSPRASDLIRSATDMHDVGNIAVSNRVLGKPGPLTRSERAEMQRHALAGYRILAGSRSETLQTGARIAWAHHERWDGSGYPRGLKGKETAIEARIAAVADVFASLGPGARPPGALLARRSAADRARPAREQVRPRCRRCAPGPSRAGRR